ncbi:MAG: hypothetical protein Q4E33_04710 [Erysipelotrichaceae bacterium]|nr:hypothetical protein [Erysipelotrichaceae bacterium]
MKRIMNLYESCRTPIRVAYFGFILIAIGFLIQNPSVNLFYTIKSGTILFIGEFCMRIGEIIVMNLPLIFMLSIVCKRANSGSPLVMALVGYFTFLVTTMLFSNQSLGAQAYTTGIGVNSVFNLANGARYPLETGLIGSLLVAYITRFSYVASRNRSSYSILAFFNKDTAGIIYNIVFCFLGGIVISYGYPFLYKAFQNIINYIGQDLMDPVRLGIYGIFDRITSILGLSNIIRYPFWFTSLGGSYSNTLTGQSILGDVNIWTAVKDTTASYVGAGRFITPYYVINMFIVPAMYLGILTSMSDKQERNHYISVFILAMILSIIAGNPLPLELILLFTAPFLFAFYLLSVGTLFGVLSKIGAYLGFEFTGTNTSIAMPGSFPDFIINIRNPRVSSSLTTIVIVGLIAFVVCFIFSYLYYHYFAYDLVKTGKGDELIDKCIDAVGGIKNISNCGSGLFRLNFYLNDLEDVSFEKVRDLGARKITETRNGISIEFGTSSTIIARRINRRRKKAA